MHTALRNVLATCGNTGLGVTRTGIITDDALTALPRIESTSYLPYTSNQTNLRTNQMSKIHKDINRIEMDTVGRISSVARKLKVNRQIMPEVEKLNKEYFTKLSEIMSKASEDK